MHKRVIISLLLLGVSACTKVPPKDPDNICAIFLEYPKWYWAAKEAQIRWRVPMSVQMAIMHQESRFSAIARPPRKKLLWIIPWKRPSSAYGYTQALDSTWKAYKKSSQTMFASRDDFTDAVDFIGWYGYRAYRRAKIPRDNAYKLYLAYHEGIGGYQRRTYLKKPWLIKVAKKVQAKANSYKTQLSHCQRRLPKKPWYRIW